MTERDGIIYIGQHKFMYLKAIMGWCKAFGLDYDLSVLATSTIKELKQFKNLARHRRDLHGI